MVSLKSGLDNIDSLLQTILEQFPVGVIIADIDSRIIFANNEIDDILGEKTFNKYSNEIGKDTTLKVFDIEGRYVEPKDLPISKAISSKKVIKDVRYKIVKNDSVIEQWVVVNASPIYSETKNIIGAVSVCIDLSEYTRAQVSAKESYAKLQKTLEGTVQAIALSVEARDSYTSDHQRRVSLLAEAIAIKMGLSFEQVTNIKTAGAIHDLGKISVPSDILSKPSKLTEAEHEIIREHPKIGYDILSKIEFPFPLAEIVYQHHERCNGSGYPRKLKSDEILIEAKIIAVADVVEAVASHRPYREALGISAAWSEIVKGKNTLFDEQVVLCCIYAFLEDGYTL